MEKIFPRDAYAWLYWLWKSAANQLEVARLKDHPDARRRSTAITHDVTLAALELIAVLGSPWDAHQAVFPTR